MFKRSAAFIVCTMLSLILMIGCTSKGVVSKKEATESTVSPAPTAEMSEKAQEEETEVYVIFEEYESKAISKNLVNEDAKKNLVIYLPPSYYESEKKYPVVYYLHGFGEGAGGYINANSNVFDKVFADSDKEFIFIEVDGRTAEGGSFYYDSPVTGNWEEYTTQEVVSYIDSNYRTMARPESRGICGFSMGGYAGLNLAMLHPDIYGAVYSMSPGIIAEGKLKDALDTWKGDTSFLNAYSMAFAYDTKDPYGKIPTLDGSKEDNEVMAMWENGFGNWAEKLDSYLALKTPLRAIGLSYGTLDSYHWIPEGTQYFSDLLDEKAIEHTLFNFEGGHRQPKNSAEKNLIPFFYEALVW